MTPIDKPTSNSPPTGITHFKVPSVRFRTPTVVDDGVHETIKPRIQDNALSQPPDPPTDETPCITTTNRCTATPSAAGSIMNESLVAIMSSMENMSASYDLPHVKFRSLMDPLKITQPFVRDLSSWLKPGLLVML